MDGIGYSWIIAVFIITAFTTPIIKYLIEKVSMAKWVLPLTYWIIALVLFVFQANHIIVKALLYICGYVFLTLIGFSICKEMKMQKPYLIGGIIVLFCCICVILLHQEDVFDISGNKYPPTVYYITYGMTVSLLLMILLSRFEKRLSLLRVTKYINELSRMSFDIYLWHVFGLYIANKIENIWLKFVVVVCVALAGAILYNMIKRAVMKK
jgi:peptidoglycan/LPS O-acetylase OafA/YrhL